MKASIGPHLVVEIVRAPEQCPDSEAEDRSIENGPGSC